MQELSAKDRQLFARMMGGTAGYLDQSARNELIKDPVSGKVTYNNGAHDYLDKVSSVIMNQQAARPVQSIVPKPARYPQQQPIKQVAKHQEMSNPLDISRYIGAVQEQKQSGPNREQLSQIELIQKALQPIHDQLEKVCILLGLIYKSLENTVVEPDDEEGEEPEPEAEPIEPAEILEQGHDSVDDEIHRLERKIKSTKAVPVTLPTQDPTDDLL